MGRECYRTVRCPAPAPNASSGAVVQASDRERFDLDLKLLPRQRLDADQCARGQGPAAEMARHGFTDRPDLPSLIADDIDLFFRHIRLRATAGRQRDDAFRESPVGLGVEAAV